MTTPFSIESHCPGCNYPSVQVDVLHGDNSYEGHCPKCGEKVSGMLFLKANGVREDAYPRINP